MLCMPGRLNQTRIPYSSLASYRYQLYTDGATASFYDQSLRAAGLVLQTESPFSTWMSGQFEAWQHHVPIARDLSDLQQAVVALEADPARAQAIFENGNARLRELLSWTSVDCYLSGVFSRYQRLFDEARRSGDLRPGSLEGACPNSSMFEVCPFRGEPAQVEGQEPPLYHSSCGAPLFDGKVAGGKASGGSKTGGAAVGGRRQNAAGGKADGAQVKMRYELRGPYYVDGETVPSGVMRKSWRSQLASEKANPNGVMSWQKPSYDPERTNLGDMLEREPPWGAAIRSEQAIKNEKCRRRRFETLEDAKRACDANQVCGGIVRDGGMECPRHRHNE
uniref:Glycosyl transferase CAP10 domain-containing protein n=1 Tax=Haptolina ericina TaxID=156174 RepID=A0A6T9LS05_9EUKA|mmetsp:Transcript_61697/g.137488  ORF Transcript_61697/g.137488 Transcript_61697/m.137488 type:complete len:335 (+) Transcript_61697:1038-2042(+)